MLNTICKNIGFCGKIKVTFYEAIHILKIQDKTSISQKSRQEEIEYPDNVNLYCPNYLTGLTKKDLKNIRKTMRL